MGFEQNNAKNKIMLYNNSKHQTMVDIINFASIALKQYLSYNSIVNGQ